MNIRLYNARILTMEPGREVFYGEVWVKKRQDRLCGGTERTCGGMGQIPVPQNCVGYRTGLQGKPSDARI